MYAINENGTHLSLEKKKLCPYLHLIRVNKYKMIHNTIMYWYFMTYHQMLFCVFVSRPHTFSVVVQKSL